MLVQGQMAELQLPVRTEAEAQILLSSTIDAALLKQNTCHEACWTFLDLFDNDSV